jgi:ATP-dependent Zn protease
MQQRLYMNLLTYPRRLAILFIVLQIPLYTLSLQKSQIEEHAAYTTKYVFQELWREKTTPQISHIPTLSPEVKKVFFEAVFYGSCALVGLYLAEWIRQKRQFRTTSYRPAKSTIKFSDVAMSQKVQKELEGLRDSLVRFEEYKKAGIPPTESAIFYGGPGNGKTLIAKALAGEVDAAFITAAGSDFDEIDSLGGKRSRHTDGADAERNDTLNAFFVEMNTLVEEKLPIVVLGATNRENSLDEAFVRDGRMGKKIKIEKPDLDARKKIFALNFDKIKLSCSNLNLDELAELTHGFSGATISHAVIYPTIRQAVCENKRSVDQQDFVNMINKIKLEQEEYAQKSEQELFS